MNPNDIRAMLLEEHRLLRGLLRTVHGLAERHVIGEPVADELGAALVELRRAFAAHNISEENALDPLLRRDPAWGAARVARMIEEHVAEHRIFRELLSGTVEQIAAAIADISEEIEAHMEAEERTFLSPRVLVEHA